MVTSSFLLCISAVCIISFYILLFVHTKVDLSHQLLCGYAKSENRKYPVQRKTNVNACYPAYSHSDAMFQISLNGPKEGLFARECVVGYRYLPFCLKLKG